MSVMLTSVDWRTESPSKVTSSVATETLLWISQIQRASNARTASATLVDEVRRYFSCQTVIVGESISSQGCKLLAFSEHESFDRQSEVVAAAELAMDEAMAKGGDVVLPPRTSFDRTSTLAHQRAVDLFGASGILSHVENTEHGAFIWLFFLKGQEEQASLSRFVNEMLPKICGCLSLLKQAKQNPLRRSVCALLGVIRQKRCLWIAFAFVVMMAVLAVPATYKVHCECQLQPRKVRYVVAPYDGVLEQTQVKPGQEVKEGQVLARMDGRELRWELAGLEADFNRANKLRETKMALGAIGDSQQVAFELERLDLKIQLVKNRLKNLEIRSPINGVVTSGDLQRAEGATLKIGQSMFEIAPLNNMLLEVEIPEREVLHTAVGQRVRFHVDAEPRSIRTGRIESIHPRAELRPTSAVFVAEVLIEDSSASLRPGMKGHAKVETAEHSLGWNLFHRPIDSLRLYLGW